MFYSFRQTNARFILGSLSNHDDDGNKNLTNLHIWQWKTVFFARFARAVFIFWHLIDVLVLFTTWNDLFCRCVDDVSIWWQMFNVVFLCPKRWFQFNSRIVRTHFSSMMKPKFESLVSQLQKPKRTKLDFLWELNYSAKSLLLCENKATFPDRFYLYLFQASCCEICVSLVV